MKKSNVEKKQHLTDKLAIKYKRIHYSKKTRLQWKWVSVCIYFIIFLLFIGVAVCWTLAGLKFDENLPNQYSWPTSKVLFAVGIIGFIVAIVLLILFGYGLATIFNKSRLIYFQSNEYARKRMEYMESDLTNCSRKEIKWLYKLRYIDEVKRDVTLKKIKNKSKK